MGKKSKKKSQGNKSGSSPALAPNKKDGSSVVSLDNIYPPYPVPPNDAACWICLEENHSAEDPLVRDCSCRGSAGWGHLRCIVHYAQQKSKEIGESNDNREWTHPFILCSNCHQIHNKRLMIDVANELVSFVQTSIPCDPLFKELGFQYNPAFYVEALLVKLRCYSRPQLDTMQFMRNVMSNKLLDFAREGIKLGSEMLSITDRMKQHSEEIFGTPSLPARITQLEACAHGELGNLYMMTGKTEDVIEILIHFNQYRDLSASIGDLSNVQEAELKIIQAEKTFGFSNKKMEKSQINVLRERYKQNPHIINNGMALVVALSTEGYAIEAQRLATKLLSNSRQVNGPDNDTTKAWERMMEQVSQRKVHLISGGRKVAMNAIGYENDNENHVILKNLPSIDDATKDEDGTTISARPDELTLTPGTPVICHGLINACHLNGKIGDARKFDCKSKRYEVHFEDAGLKPCSVKAINLRILFELPPE